MISLKSARAAGLDMDSLADQMRARKKTATAELKGHPEIPAETRTFQGDDVDSALADEPIAPSRPADDMGALR